MIEKVRLVNFKSHADTEIAFGRLTALIGPNSAGKTSVLEALIVAGRFTHQEIDDIYQDHKLSSLTRHGKDLFEVKSAGAQCDHKSTLAEWSFMVKVPPENRSKLYIEGRWGNDVVQTMLQYDHLNNPTLLEKFKPSIGNAVHLKVTASFLRESTYSEAIPPVVEEDGRGLASAVAYLMTSEPDQYSKLMKALKAVVPAVERVLTRPARVRRSIPRSISVNEKTLAYEEDQEVIGQELLFDMIGAKKIPAHAVSEGTLITLGILTAISSPESPNLILIDDIEQGLHPKAQRELVGQLRKILEQRPELQIVLTSHSPYIVDELAADEVWVLATDAEGTSHARRLSDHPEADEWLKILSTGEFWDAQGEEWILEHGE